MRAEIHGQIDLNEPEEETRSGTFSEDIYRNLPELLRRGTALLEGSDREVFFVAALATVSSLLPNVQTVYYKKAVEANLYIFLSGSFGSGKGSATFAKEMASPIHKYHRGAAAEPTERKLHFLPANSSKTGFIELLEKNGRGLVFETESDTLADILRQEFGDFSDILRKSYHHETVTVYRRQNKEYYDIERPYLSVLLTGTPGQLRRLLPTTEDGLFSRFNYYRMQTDTEFKDVFAGNGQSIDHYFYDIGEQLLVIYKWLKQRHEPVMFSFSRDQKPEFLNYFSRLKRELIETYGEEMDGIVNRFGLQFTRIAMILTTLRAYETETLADQIICSEMEFQTARQIMEVFMSNTLQLYGEMTKPDISTLTSDKRHLIEALPEEFTTAQAVTAGLNNGIPEPTLKRFLNNRKYFDHLRHGTYRNKCKIQS